jgi:tetratricopeptide (TPR) repeat protein
LGLCYLQLKLYPLAEKSFERSIQIMPENPDTYYYHALAVIRGRALMTLTLAEAEQVLQYAEAATQMDSSRSKYLYLAGLIKADYYERSGMRVPGASVDELERLLQSVTARDPRMVESLKRRVST